MFERALIAIALALIFIGVFSWLISTMLIRRADVVRVDLWLRNAFKENLRAFETAREALTAARTQVRLRINRDFSFGEKRYHRNLSNLDEAVSKLEVEINRGFPPL